MKNVLEGYQTYTKKKALFILALIFLSLGLLVLSISVGVVSIPPGEVMKSLLGYSTNVKYSIIVRAIRLPHALAALLAGAGLATAGVAMQSILRNPLGSPFTLGISQAGAFGAALSVILAGGATSFSTGTESITISAATTTTIFAFIAAMSTSFIIISVSTIRGSSPEVMVLCGVALGSLFSAGTMFLQYLADDIQLAAMVFWSFGDVSRAGWSEVSYMALLVVGCLAFFVVNRWNYNAIDAGDETAVSLGVDVHKVRLKGMAVASLLTAVIVSFLGVIGFVGLVCPHIMRKLVGDDMRFLMPASCLGGAVLLLSADIASRLMLAPHVLPVAILTSFLGAPVFLYLLVRKGMR